MECPFYMLDEFDVYMDALNRKASQHALMGHAKLFKSNQFFLYTPLELCEVPAKTDALTLR
jgi:chromosome segregation ATPase